MKVNALVINQKDSVAVALEPLRSGDTAVLNLSGVEKKIPIVTDVPIYHKFSIVPIKNGDVIYKYGENIGLSTCDISVGEHVHSHNLRSVRELIETI